MEPSNKARTSRNTSPNPRETAFSTTRRGFSRRLAWTAIGLWAGLSGLTKTPFRTASAAHHETVAPTANQLATSPFVYISPLRSDGKESSCHAELWYGWLDDSIIVTVSSDGWKARALAGGLDRARIWVGDQGRWKTWYGGRNESFRDAPHFDARVERAEDPELLDRLLTLYETKYPEEISDWRDAMREGDADGSRVLLRYTALEA